MVSQHLIFFVVALAAVEQCSALAFPSVTRPVTFKQDRKKHHDSHCEDWCISNENSRTTKCTWNECGGCSHCGAGKALDGGGKSGQATASCSTVTITSVDHRKGSIGKYFNFKKEDLNGWPTRNSAPYATRTLSITNTRTGRTMDVLMWDVSNGGSTGNAHGRKRFGPRTGMFQVGDVLSTCSAHEDDNRPSAGFADDADMESDEKHSKKKTVESYADKLEDNKKKGAEKHSGKEKQEIKSNDDIGDLGSSGSSKIKSNDDIGDSGNSGSSWAAPMAPKPKKKLNHAKKLSHEKDDKNKPSKVDDAEIADDELPESKEEGLDVARGSEEDESSDPDSDEENNSGEESGGKKHHDTGMPFDMPVPGGMPKDLPQLIPHKKKSKKAAASSEDQMADQQNSTTAAESSEDQMADQMPTEVDGNMEVPEMEDFGGEEDGQGDGKSDPCGPWCHMKDLIPFVN